MHQFSSSQKNSLPHAHLWLCFTFLTCTVCHRVPSPSSRLSFACPHLLYWSLEKSFFALHLEKVFYLPITKSKPAPSSLIFRKNSPSQCARSKTLLWILLGEKPTFLAKPLEEGNYLHHPMVTFLHPLEQAFRNRFSFVSTNDNASWSIM